MKNIICLKNTKDYEEFFTYKFKSVPISIKKIIFKIVSFFKIISKKRFERIRIMEFANRRRTK